MAEEKQDLFDVELDLTSKKGILDGYGKVAEGMRTRRVDASTARVFLALLKQAGDLLTAGTSPSGPAPGGEKRGRKDVEDISGPGPGPGVTASGPMGVFKGESKPGNPWSASDTEAA